MPNDNRTREHRPATEGQKANAEADFKRHQAKQALDKTVVPKIIKAWGQYSDNARKGLPYAAEAGTHLRRCKAECKENAIVWQRWCDDQQTAHPGKFPTRYWADKLIKLAEGWELVKDQPGITSIEGAVLFIRGKGTDQGQPIKHKGTGKRRVKLGRSKVTEALTAQGVDIDPDTFLEVLDAVGIKAVFVDEAEAAAK